MRDHGKEKLSKKNEEIKASIDMAAICVVPVQEKKKNI